MGEQPQVQVIEADRAEARAQVRQTARGTTVGGIALILTATFAGVGLAQVVLPDLEGIARAGVSALIAGAIVAPFLMAMAGVAKRRGVEMGSAQAAQERVMRAEVRRREFQSRLGRALEMSDDEPAAYDVIERAIGGVAPETAVEVLLADNSHAHLERIVSVIPNGEREPACPVDSPDRCVAARRAQTQVFPDSEDLDACPLLRGRERDTCSAVCVPVSIMGRTVGVVHAVGAVGKPLGDAAVQQLQTLANQAGNRLGMLRVMAETHMQAATDGLTGLVNRRSFENRLRHMQNEGIEFALVMADLDRFKRLNDGHGHETGDRALRIFADTLRHELRVDDLACRYGGEEFAIVLPLTDTGQAIEIVERIRQALSRATGRGDTPTFTASFGVAHSEDAEDLKDLVSRADQALFAAKEAGRNRTCLDGHSTPVVATLTALG